MTTPPYIYRLMGHTALARTFKLGPEDREAYGFSNSLRAATINGTLKAVWLHPANELAVGARRKTTEGFRMVIPPLVALAKALGLITGASDYLFLWNRGCCAIEFKSKTGSLRDAQKDFRDWCVAMNVPHHVARSEEAGLEILRGHGVLTDRDAQ